MPHKHKLKKGKDVEGQFDLPPTESARPLPVIKRNGNGITPGKQIAKKRPRSSTKANDTPRAFRRLMAVAGGKKIRSGLDDGDAGKTTIQDANLSNEKLQIRPGENLGAFASRVDAALPVSGLAKKTTTRDGKDELGLKVYRTRKERKMHKLYDQWREEERKIQQKKEDELEEIAERDLEDDAAGILTSAAFQDENSQGVKRKGKKRRKQVDEDPWLVLKKLRAEKKPKVHEVPLAPLKIN
ncbi:uncharacterized protein TrAFT101_009072 [Trichoderma asperellum]|uniref:uncharacterized protein n=1 Tax=Trichoderma asperellum TaxID=101201 RepID=UPI0033342DBD|nr:hypothetical protein TrAFT101_009072 [Trichoderma asperellum]